MKDNLNYSVNHKGILQDDHELLELSNDGDFAIKLDLSFLTWRISNNPHHEKLYNIYFSSNEKPIAHIIFNYHKDGIWYLINDIYSKRLNYRQRSLILKNAVRILLKNKSDDVKLIRTWDFTHNEHGKLEIKTRSRTGFFHIERGVSFVWKGLDDSNLLDVNKFHLSRIATQGVI